MEGLNKLKVTVHDTVQIADSLKKAIVLILEAFKQWVVKEGNEPFSLVVEKIADKGPPVLEINVKEEVKTKTAFG